MNETRHTYQAMFLLENQEVRQKGFNAVRDGVKQTLEKHGITVRVLRLWGERAMAYRIGGRSRATYVLGWLEASGTAVNEAKRELYLVGPAFRCLFLREEMIPADELALGIPAIGDNEVVIPDDNATDFEEPAPETEQDPADEMDAVGMGGEGYRRG
jgi:ribosomal protein S6